MEWVDSRHVARISPRGGGGRRLERAPSRAFKGPLLEPSDSTKGPFQSNQGGPLTCTGALWTSMGPSGLSERALVALRTSKLSKNCASRGLVGPFRRAARAEKGPPGLQGGRLPPPPPPPWLRAWWTVRDTTLQHTYELWILYTIWNTYLTHNKHDLKLVRYLYTPLLGEQSNSLLEVSKTKVLHVNQLRILKSRVLYPRLTSFAALPLGRRHLTLNTEYRARFRHGMNQMSAQCTMHKSFSLFCLVWPADRHPFWHVRLFPPSGMWVWVLQQPTQPRGAHTGGETHPARLRVSWGVCSSSSDRASLAMTPGAVTMTPTHEQNK